MYDSSQFILPQKLIQRYFTHQGIIGKGRDYLTGTSCTIHLYIDPSSNKKYALQLYQNVDTNFHDLKVQHLVKSATAQSIPNYARVIFLTSNKTSSYCQFSVMYDVSQLYGMSMENLLSVRLKNGQLFKQSEVMQFLGQILDSLYFGGSKHGQYLEVTPINIFVRPENKNRYRYFPNNFGLNFAGTKWQKKYYNPNEEWPPKSIQTGLNQAIFIIGMITLQMCTLQDVSTFYNGNTIDEKLLLKSLEGIKLNYPNELFIFISGMCAINPNKRLKLKQIYSKDSYLLLYRKIHFHQGKLGNYKRLTGFLLPNDQIQCFAETTNQKLQLYRGSFISGKYQGYGVLDKQRMYIGQFSKGQFKYGICILRNNSILLGTFENGNPVKITQFTLNIYTLTSPQKNLLFIGRMNCLFEKQQGKLIQKDGSIYQGSFVNNKKSGKSKYKSFKNKTQIQGKWENDLLQGPALYIQQGHKYQAIFRNGKIESKKQI